MQLFKTRGDWLTDPPFGGKFRWFINRVSKDWEKIERTPLCIPLKATYMHDSNGHSFHRAPPTRIKISSWLRALALYLSSMSHHLFIRELQPLPPKSNPIARHIKRKHNIAVYDKHKGYPRGGWYGLEGPRVVWERWFATHGAWLAAQNRPKQTNKQQTDFWTVIHGI